MMVGFDHNIEAAAAGTNPLVVKIPKELESEKEKRKWSKSGQMASSLPDASPPPIKLLLFKQNI